MRKVTAFVLGAFLAVAGSVAVAQESAPSVQADWAAKASSAKAAAGIQSDSALPMLFVDVEKKAGWMVYLEGGYQWNFFRDAGLEVRNRNGNGGNRLHRTTRNHTEGGVAGAVAFGYNFCPKFPLTLGFKIGAGPSNKLEGAGANVGAGTTNYWQRVGLYTFDFALDYDFKNKSRVTPFVGINFGAALVSTKARAWYDDGLGNANSTYFGKYDTKRRINLMGGVRTGVKYDVNSRVALTFFGQYSYLGTIKGRSFEMENSTGNKLDAHTTKMKAHMLEAKMGIRIAF